MARVQELMMPGGNRTLLLIALIAGAVAAVVVFVAVSNSDGGDGETSQLAGDTVPVLVAKESISAGERITEGMVEVRQVPGDLRIAGALEETELAVGEVSKIAISEGEQINSAKIGLPVPDKGLPGVVPAGMRGVGVEVDEVTAVGGNLLPGDRVDIVASFEIKRAPGLEEDQYILRTETILQNVEVISVAQEAQEPSAGSNATDEDVSSSSGQIPDDVEEQPNADTLTLALAAADTNRLISVQEYAVRIWAVVRPFGDNEIVDIAPQEVVLIDD